MTKPSFESFTAGYELNDDTYELGEIVEADAELRGGRPRRAAQFEKVAAHRAVASTPMQVHAPLMRFGAAGLSPLRDKALSQPRDRVGAARQSCADGRCRQEQLCRSPRTRPRMQATGKPTRRAATMSRMTSPRARSPSWRRLPDDDSLSLHAVVAARSGALACQCRRCRRAARDARPRSASASPCRPGRTAPLSRRCPAISTSRSTGPRTSSASTRAWSSVPIRSRTSPTSSRTIWRSSTSIRPDFPWLLTPARATAATTCGPGSFSSCSIGRRCACRALKPGRPLPSIELDGGTRGDRAARSLRVVAVGARAGRIGEGAKADEAGLAAEMKQFQERNISRLVCPRRLEPRKNYVACVVPATTAAVCAGWVSRCVARNLGRCMEPCAAHGHRAAGVLPLGVLDRSRRRHRNARAPFGTPQQYAGDPALIAQLRHIGEQPVAVDGDHLLFDGSTPGRTVFEGAMVSLDFQPEAPNTTFAEKLEAILDSGQALASRGTPKADTVPTLSPPIYGEHPARRHAVDRARINAHWLDGLSLQPRYRLAAGWGAEVVRQNQDEFMQAAWEQVGEVLAAERAFSLARLSRDVLKEALKLRHLDKLPEARLARGACTRARAHQGRGGSHALRAHRRRDASRRALRRRDAPLDERAAAHVQDGAVARTQSRRRERSAADDRARRYVRECVEASRCGRSEPLRPGRPDGQRVVRRDPAARKRPMRSSISRRSSACPAR